MVEGHHEELVAGIEKVLEKRLDRLARVVDAAAVHAVADVQQNRQADGNALVGELGNLLPDAVLVNLEGLARQPGHQAAVLIADRGGDAGQLHRGTEDARIAQRLVLAGPKRAQGGGEQRDPEGHESATG